MTDVAIESGSLSIFSIKYMRTSVSGSLSEMCQHMK